MPVTVHHHGPVRQVFHPANKPIAVNQRRADAVRKRLSRPRIFNHMVVQGEDPAGSRELISGNLDPSYLLG